MDTESENVSNGVIVVDGLSTEVTDGVTMDVSDTSEKGN